MTFPITPIFAAAAAHGEKQLLELGGSSTASHAASGGSIARTIVGLGIVIAVIFGLRWVLKQFKAGREKKAAGGGLSSMATLPLGQNRSLHVVRAGREVLVVGSGEHGVTPVRSYSEEEARALGLLEDEVEEAAPLTLESKGASSGGTARVLDTVRSWTVRG
ncbi:MAG TPA: flagellar biosynthetic protein FliO [Solirubrobacterales bacterium]|nr:flagellar biosynthetic protein FliO [Solirubrobacterales bacterium]